MRTCSGCGLDKPLAEMKYRRCKACLSAAQRARYQADPEKYRQRERDRRAVMPKDAYNDYQRAYRARNPEKHRLWAQEQHIRNVGLTVERYQDLLEAQGGRCAICRRDEPGGKGRWHIDHDHSCCPGKSTCGTCVRGLLCFACNVALGYFKDDPERLRAALEYLNQSARIGGTS